MTPRNDMTPQSPNPDESPETMDQADTTRPDPYTQRNLVMQSLIRRPDKGEQ